MILDLQHISETPMHNFKGGDGMVYTRMYSDDLNRIMLARITPGSSIGMHTHETNSEIVYVLSGDGTDYDGRWGKRLSMPDRRTIARRDIGMRPTVRGMRIWWFMPSSRSMGRGNKKPLHPRGREKRPSRATKKGSRGNCPLQGAGTASLLGFGATPQLFHGRPACQTCPTKGAGSEASLHLTLRVLRRAPKLLFPQIS